MAKGNAAPKPRARGTGKQKAAVDDDIPEPFRELLEEVARSSPMRSDTEGRPIKRRRVGGRSDRVASRVKPELLRDSGLDNTWDTSPALVQSVYESTEDDFEDADVDWEDVGAPSEVADDDQSVADSETTEQKPLEISLESDELEKQIPAIQRRKPATAAERRVRLDVHKMHLLCLLGHLHLRNHWCNDEVVQSTLKSLLSRKTISLLHVPEDKLAFQRSQSFLKGIQEVCDIWKVEYRVTEPGMRRSYWAADDAQAGRTEGDLLETASTIYDKASFRRAANERTGSRDTGAQLFCALLRSVAVEARLVCSMQPLPFTGVAKGMTPEKPRAYIMADSLGPKSSGRGLTGGDSDSASSSVPRRIRRLGQPQFSGTSAPTAIPKITVAPRRRIPKSQYPVMWVEVFNETDQKWIPVDPVVRHTINKPKTGFEPPASDRLNNLSYVVSFDEDLTAIDVTRRYTRHYNAKTRKVRVEATADGDKWWERTMRFFGKKFQEDRDQVEAGELAAREAAEEMPRNVQDFKDHPHYALERHLRRSEAIHPRREVGKVSVGVKDDQALEPIYRRRDVHTVRSADKWYRLGRDIKVGEQPLKRAAPKRNRSLSPDEEEGETTGAGLYAVFQTQVYKPPPVVGGKVPRNAYGNLDVYVPSMVPTGGIHVPHPEAGKAAKTIGVDYADAVTGFDFKGRRGTAVVKGIVVAEEYHAALVEVLRCFNNERAKAADDVRTAQILGLWKNFLIGLRVKERVKEYLEDGEEAPAEEQIEGELLDEMKVGAEGGGFFLTENDGMVAEPTARPYRMPLSDYGLGQGGGEFVADDSKLFVPNEVAGGFVANDLFEGGGFAAEDQQNVKAPLSSPESKPEKSLSSIGSNGGFGQDTSRVTHHGDAPTPQSYSVLDQPQFELIVKKAPASERKSLSPMLNPKQDSVDVPHHASYLTPASDGRQAAPKAQKPVSEASESEGDQHSLISHDPEDEDADPEWLMSD